MKKINKKDIRNHIILLIVGFIGMTLIRSCNYIKEEKQKEISLKQATIELSEKLDELEVSLEKYDKSVEEYLNKEENE